MKWTAKGVGVLAVSAVVVGGAVVRAAEEPEVRREKRVVRMARAGGGYLGVSLGEIGADAVKRLGLADERGALISDVVEDSPAAKAGLKADDVIVGFDGETVRSAAHLSRLVRETPAGRSVDLAYLRGGARQAAKVALGESRARFPGMGDLKIEGLDRLRDGLDAFEVPEPPEPPEPPAVPEAGRPPRAPRPPRPPVAFEHFRAFPGFGIRPRLGIEVVDLTEQLAGYFKVEDGVLVSSVRAGSPAEKAGLRAGDIILKVDGEAVGTSGDLVRHVSRGDDARQVTLSVQRDGRPMDLRVQLEPRRTPRGPAT